MNFAAQQAIYDSDIAAVEPEMPFSFYWQGKPYAGSRNEIADTLGGSDFGYAQEYDFEIVARVNVFPAGVNVPQVNDELEIANPNPAIKARMTLTIKKAAPSQDFVTITFGVKAKN